MDVQLKDLIDTIKKDGITSASEESAKIKAQAEADAKYIIEAAQKEAASIIAKAKADAERSESAGIAALSQASRNLVLSFKAEIESLLKSIINQKVTGAYTLDVLKTTLPDLLKAWVAKEKDDLAVIVSESDAQKLQNFFISSLQSELKKGIELKSDRNLAAGFRIANKDGSAYYDFSSESVANMLSAYLNPRLAEILKTSVQGK
ncbi:MAG: V-type ATP synthase subunit E [Treponema sp.]|jgi:V/A-type H+-transporting ATPase subunit E|nr:V-type ATP synthase subunit E [Treponema sp.]